MLLQVIGNPAKNEKVHAPAGSRAVCRVLGRSFSRVSKPGERKPRSSSPHLNVHPHPVESQEGVEPLKSRDSEGLGLPSTIAGSAPPNRSSLKIL
jgi:hypothetical protein